MPSSGVPLNRTQFTLDLYYQFTFILPPVDTKNYFYGRFRIKQNDEGLGHDLMGPD